MQAIHGKRTGLEVKLELALRTGGVKGYARNAMTPVGRPDFVFGRERVALFVHGCFWHRCPVCRLPLPKSHRAFWSAKFRRNRARDKEVRNRLRVRGWTVLEVWGHELGDSDRVASVIARSVLARRKRQAQRRS